MNLPRDANSGSMASPLAQQAFAQQMQLAIQSQRVEQAQQDARARKEETKQLKIAALQKRREEEKAKREAAKAKSLEQRLAAKK
jgi:hypothetical protein